MNKRIAKAARMATSAVVALWAFVPAFVSNVLREARRIDLVSHSSVTETKECGLQGGDRDTQREGTLI
ncbi:MAG TPA: hypothetical protein VIG24_03815 [Acidimicrobiia bacterium]